MKGQRLFYIDTAAGFLILYMINFHLSDWNWCTKYDPVIPTSWFDFAVPFMAWFFYKAGMFHKEHTIKETILGGYKKLIIPFLVFTVIGHILHCIRLWVEFDTTSWVDYILYPFASILIRGAANGNFALWFLLSLFFVKVIISILEKYNVNLIIAGIIFFALGALLDIVSQELNSKFFPLYFGNTCLGLFFYLMGKYLRNCQYKWVVFIICTIGYVVINKTIGSIGYEFRTNNGGGQYFLCAVSAICFIVFFNNLTKRISLQWTGLYLVGRDAMIWYVCHWPLLTLSRLIFYSGFGIPEGWTLRVIQSLFILFLCPIISILLKSERYKFMVGR